MGVAWFLTSSEAGPKPAWKTMARHCRAGCGQNGTRRDTRNPTGVASHAGWMRLGSGEIATGPQASGNFEI